MMEDNNSLEWEAPEFKHIEKEPIWFLATGLFAAVFLIFAIWQQNLLFAIFIIIASALMFFWAKKKPDIILFKINNDGLALGDNKFYPWRSFEYFSVFKSHQTHDNLSEIIIKRNERINPLIKLHIPINHLNEIHDFISQHLKEEEYTETYTDAIERIIKF
ncbi:MAG: hypothetical protein Q8L47_05595 [bacterium]|nr:hypothetical protein [bacterium]